MVNDEHFTAAIFLDLRKACEVFDHAILLGKLPKYGKNSYTPDWFKSYLSNRKKVVDINSIHSSSKKVDIFVKQGRLLGPILFLIYIILTTLQITHIVLLTTPVPSNQEMKCIIIHTKTKIVNLKVIV
jgi:hypothetical protein